MSMSQYPSRLVRLICLCYHSIYWPLCLKRIGMQEIPALLRNGLHSLLVNTIQTMEETGRTVCDVTNTGLLECMMRLPRRFSLFPHPALLLFRKPNALAALYLDEMVRH